MMSTGVRRGFVTTIVALGVLAPVTAFGRIWRDTKGNAINADFVRIDRDIVYLKPANKYAPASPFSYYDLSPEDQAYVNLVLEKRGEKHRIPPPREKPGGQPGAPAGGGAVPVTIVPGTQPPATGVVPNVVPPNGGIPDIASSSQPPAVPITVTPTAPPVFNSSPTPAPTVSPPIVPTAPTMGPSVPPRSIANMAPPKAPPPSKFPQLLQPSGPNRGPIGSSDVTSFQCLNCRREVPPTAKVGQKCPHCGVLWLAEEDEQGNVVQSSSSWFGGGSSSSNRNVFRAAAIIGAMIMGGIIKLVRSK